MSIPLSSPTSRTLPMWWLVSLLWSSVLVADVCSQQVEDLYTSRDPIVHLNYSNIKDTLQGKNHVWALEFYSSTCGHCRRFAPKWIRVAKQTQAWSVVLKLASINCVRPENIATCRDFNITSVPNLRLIAPNSSGHSNGARMFRGDEQALLTKMVNFVEQFQKNHSTPSWPDLQKFNGSMEDLVSGSDVPLQALVLDSSADSLVGRSVILDLSMWQDRMQVVRAVNSPGNSYLSKTVHFPALLIFKKGTRHMYTADDSPNIRRFFSSKLRQLLGVALPKPPASTSQLQYLNATNSTGSSSTTPEKLAAGTYLVDLENAVVLALTQEVIAQPAVEGEAMKTLKGFIMVLIKLLPKTTSNLTESLLNVNQWLSNKTQVSGADLQQFLDTMALPPPRSYVGCLGTSATYRGYPCSMWMLFHTLSVAALQYNGSIILPCLHDYIKHFFFCRACSEDFQRMAMEDGLWNVTRPSDTVLWLWRAHNRVNDRLAGDITEDPYHPKQQFPPRELCPLCRDDAGYFNESIVLPFLKRFYGEDALLLKGLDEVELAAEP